VDWQDRSGLLRIGGHRGDPEIAPENTMAGFEAAVAAEVDYIETDVHLSADGVLVILHDERLERTTDGCGNVADMTHDTLRQLDAGSWFAVQFRGQGIVTLEEFIGWLATHEPLGALIEAKAAGVGQQLAARISTSPISEHLAICSFLRAEIAAAKAIAPSVPCVLLLSGEGRTADPIEQIDACGADGADVPLPLLDDALAERMRAHGFAIGGGTADDAESIGKLAALGADFVDSDRPQVAVSVRRTLTIPEERNRASF
jgi:glycerophosphoryl diester phosphodiesterase